MIAGIIVILRIGPALIVTGLRLILLLISLLLREISTSGRFSTTG